MLITILLTEENYKEINDYFRSTKFRFDFKVYDMVGKALRRLRDRYRNKTRGNEVKKEREGLLCHGCNKRMNDNHPPLRHRASRHLDHYLCECGTVSHWLMTIVMVCVGHGRYRRVNVKQQSSCMGEFVPNRILPDDTLWLNPQTSTAYFFEHGVLVRFNLNELPRGFNNKYQFSLIDKGHNIKVGGRCLTFDGITFVERQPDTIDIGGLKATITYLGDDNMRSTEFDHREIFT